MSSKKGVFILPSGVRVTRKGWFQWKADNGICRDCMEPLAHWSITRCEKHATQASNWAKGYRTATRGGRSDGR